MCDRTPNHYQRSYAGEDDWIEDRRMVDSAEGLSICSKAKHEKTRNGTEVNQIFHHAFDVPVSLSALYKQIQDRSRD